MCTAAGIEFERIAILQRFSPHLSGRAAEDDGVTVGGHDVGAHGGGVHDIGVVSWGRAAGRQRAVDRDGPQSVRMLVRCRGHVEIQSADIYGRP